MTELDELILLQREMTAEIQVGNFPDHAERKIGNQLAVEGESQSRPTGLTNYDEFALNLWVAVEVGQRTGTQPGGVLSIEAYDRYWRRLVHAQRKDLEEMLRAYPGAKMGIHGRKAPVIIK